ncbi:MAG: peptidylprolyl isomerase A [Phycisphaeraceae bacterium]|nr:peptidylprolyl isomerase A [Phycisphaeraceae bacterium]MCP4011719.1 peptidylprolyl isomerase A [Phycisphaeraceae bacterium]MCP4496191.1 peptidylprolyl isomerase A [Phycisphaeraceae bacterium]MCP4794733.1 peptidylprolyl isomerase A [Phycisphaeraceae bacterium]MCP4937680.1 peptidylprolyl isomerase A [Phycisphaeraceae bacterium]|tara:strand:+ start:658 stop:1359 length:702 start_codon:yes stop_codon:yes gene_type:complete
MLRSVSTSALLLIMLLGLSPVAEASYATIKTTLGTIVVELDDEKAPISVANFKTYAKEGFYDKTLFHRVIPGFMVQGGGFDHHGAYPQTMHKKPGAKAGIKNEWTNGEKNKRATLAMARLGNQPDSATNQFFINLADNDFLDQPRDGAGYAVFAKVIGGMDVVDKIAGVPTTRLPNGMSDVPTQPMMIESIAFVTKAEADKAIVADAQARVDALQSQLDAAKKALEALKKGGE